MAVDFRVKQQQFAGYIKNAAVNAAPADVKPERMELYKQLFYNNIDSFLTANFPVLRQILTEQQWQALVTDFYGKHRCESPYFSEIPEEFLAYLQEERDCDGDYPFMLELAHYEWVEMALSIAKEEAPQQPQDMPDLGRCTLTLSPLAWPLLYQYPVHKLGPGYLPEQAPEQPTFLVVYRDRVDEVQFLEITPVTYRLLEIIQSHEQGIASETCLQQLCAELPQADPRLLIDNGLQILAQLIDKAVLAAVAA